MHNLVRVLRAQNKLEETRPFVSARLEELKRAAERPDAEPSTLNEYAWLLLTCELPDLRDPEKALTLAKKVVRLVPDYYVPWHTLGMARYRTGDYAGAIEAFEKAEKLRAGGTFAVNDLCLAMAHWQMGDKEKARELYQRAVDWLEENGAIWTDEVARREAEQLLGVTDESKNEQ